MNYWLVKSEPVKYSWTKFEEDGKAVWDGVRNYQARNNLREMKKKDKVLFYHSNEGMCVVGVAEVIKEHYQDPTTEDIRWSVVELKPLHSIKPVTLEAIKNDSLLQNVGLIKQSRLSVMPLKVEEFDRILALSAD
jgi:predicted RNA-binding protein with PUA-like domain